MLNHDLHIHLDLFPDLSKIITETIRFEIYSLAVTNHPKVFEKLRSYISSKYIRVALGLHPELVYQYRQHIPMVWEMLDSTEYIGEVGLDYRIATVEDRRVQSTFLSELLGRCNDRGGKVISIHSRFAVNDVLNILGLYPNNKIILHWFCGSVNHMRKAVKLGCYFSINYAMLSAPGLLVMIKAIPQDRLLIESDAPFIEVEGMQYYPRLHHCIIRRLALLLSTDYEGMNLILSSNFRNLLSRR